MYSAAVHAMFIVNVYDRVTLASCSVNECGGGGDGDGDGGSGDGASGDVVHSLVNGLYSISC